MVTLSLDLYQACALGALVYCLGRFLVKKLPFLGKYCIPAPVAGGIVFALAHLALYGAGILELTFDDTLQKVLMTIFYCSVGFTACFRLIKKGGAQVFIFLALAVLVCIVQDGIGCALAGAFGLCMGATPNAMANMKALTERYGPAPKAFFIVPIIGSLFIDFCNSIVLTVFMNIF